MRVFLTVKNGKHTGDTLKEYAPITSTLTDSGIPDSNLGESNDLAVDGSLHRTGNWSEEKQERIWDAKGCSGGV